MEGEQQPGQQGASLFHPIPSNRDLAGLTTLSPPDSTGTVLLRKCLAAPLQQPEWAALSPTGDTAQPRPCPDTAHSPSPVGLPPASPAPAAGSVGWAGTVTALAPHRPSCLCPLQSTENLEPLHAHDRVQWSPVLQQQSTQPCAGWTQSHRQTLLPPGHSSPGSAGAIPAQPCFLSPGALRGAAPALYKQPPRQTGS